MKTEIYTNSFLNLSSCNNYINNFLNDVEEDNTYVTMYFRKIDYRRYIKGKFTLLPLKQSEKRDITDVYMFYLTTDEKGEMIHSLITTFILMFLTIMFVVIDYFLYNVLVDIRTYGRIEYIQTGHHDLSMEIKGVGFLASILRSIAHSFVVKKRIKKYFSNIECLPKPIEPGQYNLKLAGMFFLLLLLTILNALMLRRVNMYICSLFYPKAQKKRILFLYNETFKKRITFLNYRYDIVRKNVREKRLPDQLSFPIVLRLKYPKLFKLLLFFKSSRRQCLICMEYEPTSGGDFPCRSINCYVYYCHQCWDFVVKRQCIGCANYAEPEPPSTNDDITLLETE